MTRPARDRARVISVALLLLWGPLARAEKARALLDGKAKNIIAAQEMWGLKHSFYDPQSGDLKYTIEATYAHSRTESGGTFFDAKKPVIHYYDKEQMEVRSATGVIDLRKERIYFKGKVTGFLDTARTVAFETEDAEMDFKGNGFSHRPVQLSQPGVVVKGTRARFGRAEEIAPDGQPGRSEDFRLSVLGPGTAEFEKVAENLQAPGGPNSLGEHFRIDFNGAAIFSREKSNVFFNRDSKDPADRVVLHGQGYLLKCEQMVVHADQVKRTWKRVEALGKVSYEITGRNP